MLNSGQNQRFFVSCDLEIWWMTLKNNKVPHLYYTKLCVLFQSHQWIQTGVTVWKRSILVKIWERCKRQTDRQTDRLTSHENPNHNINETSVPSRESLWVVNPHQNHVDLCQARSNFSYLQVPGQLVTTLLQSFPHSTWAVPLPSVEVCGLINLFRW